MSRHFTSVPVDPSIAIVQLKLQQDPLLSQRTSMTIPQIIILSEFCVKNTYFPFQGKYYEQVHGAGRGSQSAPLLPTCTWKRLKSRPQTLPLCLWFRFVDNTFVIQQVENTKQLLQHINDRTHTLNLPLKNPTRMVPYPSWILWLPQAQTTP